MIDFDDATLYAPWCELVEMQYPGLVQRLTVAQTPRPGYHVLYRCESVEGNQVLARFASDNGQMPKASIETRGEGGYVLAPGCPPECHETGRTYEWLAGDHTTIPTITPEEREVLLNAARAFNKWVDDRPTANRAEQPPVDSCGIRPGDEFAAQTSWDEILTPRGWKEVRPDLWKRPGKAGPGWSASTAGVSQAGIHLFHCFSSNAAPFEPNKSYSKFAVHSLLNHGGDFEAAARELRSKGFGSQGDGEDGVLDWDSVIGVGAYAASPVGGGEESATGETNEPAGAEPVTGEVTTEDVNCFGRLTCAELDDLVVEHSYLIEEILADQQDGLIAGKFKSHKTHIGAAAAFAIATATPFLGKFTVSERRRVGYFNAEGGTRRLQSMARKLAANQGVQLRDVDSLLWYTSVPTLKRVDHVHAFKQAIERDRLDVVFIDPAYFALRGNADKASNYFAMGEILSIITEVSHAMKVTTLVTTHNKRSPAREFSIPELEDISYPGFAEWARQWVLLGHRKPWDADKHRAWLWMSVGGYEHSGDYALDVDEGERFEQWSVRVEATGEAREQNAQQKADQRKESQRQKREADLEAMIDRLRTAFRSVPGNTLTKRQLAERAGTDTRTKGFLEAVGQMLRVNEIESVDVECKNNTTAEGYRRLFTDE